MGRYRDQPFKERFKSMGDEAEGVYRDIEPLGKSERNGWRRPKVSMKRMPPVLAHKPDFYADSGHLVEVMGLGKDGILKLKLDKYESLKFWHQACDVVLFLWNSHHRQWVVLGWDQIKRLVAKGRNAGIEEFNDGNQYFPVQWEWIVEMASFVGQL